MGSDSRALAVQLFNLGIFSFVKLANINITTLK